jgi:hypothetical protein
VSTTKEAAIDAAGYMFVGSITTPISGGPDTQGNNDGGGGSQIGSIVILQMSTVSTPSIGGNGAIANPANAIDGNPTTFAKLTLTGNGSLNGVGNWLLSGPPGVSSAYYSATLIVRFAVPTNSLLPSGSNVVANITYGNITGTVSGTILAAVPGTTEALQTVSVPLPLGLNLSQFVVTIQITSNTGSGDATSGSLELDVYDCHIEVEQ